MQADLRFHPTTTARAIEAALAKHANSERVEILTGGYAPSGLRYIGATVPDLRDVVRRFARELNASPAREILSLAHALVARRTAEGRQVGYELVARRVDAMRLLTPASVKRLGRGNDNWASVDGFAMYITGRAWLEGRIKDRDVMAWARSADPWWRRTALASTVSLNVASRGGTGDRRRTLRICREFAHEKSPMLAKALSWALRSLVPHDAAAVRAFLSRHRETLPAVVLREVRTKLRTGRKTE